jgi:hypothetical protein
VRGAARSLACAVCFCFLCSAGWPQARRDPLTPTEADALRDAAQVPDERIKLFIIFARTRLTTLETVRSDPKATDRAGKIHDQLQDFVDIYDELNDNIDTFVARKSDLRKPLKLVIDADTEFQAKLRALKTGADSKPSEASQYEFLLNTAMDTVDSSVSDHRQLLDEQEEAAKHKGKHGP